MHILDKMLVCGIHDGNIDNTGRPHICRFNSVVNVTVKACKARGESLSEVKGDDAEVEEDEDGDDGMGNA